MNILMLISELGYGGAESAFLRLAEHLSTSARVHIAVFKERYANEDYSQSDQEVELQIHRLDAPLEERRLARWRRRRSSLADLRRSLAADATISFLTGPNLLNVSAGGPGKKLVSIRGSRQFDAHASKLSNAIHNQLLDRWVAARADAVVTVSHGLTGEFLAQHPQAASKVHTISGYVDAELLIATAADPIEPGYAEWAGPSLLVAAGRLSPEKGFQHLLRIFAQVRSELPAARLLLIGDGPMRQELMAEAAKLGLRAGADPGDGIDVLMPGYRPSPHRYFRLGKAFALTSASEGFPNVLIEALASGTQVLVADAPWGAREILGLKPDPWGRAFPSLQPTASNLGSLLPRIDDPRFTGIWIAAIAEQLSQVRPDEAWVARAHARVREFDCSLAARRWTDLIKSLGRQGA